MEQRAMEAAKSDNTPLKVRLPSQSLRHFHVQNIFVGHQAKLRKAVEVQTAAAARRRGGHGGGRRRRGGREDHARRRTIERHPLPEQRDRGRREVDGRLGLTCGPMLPLSCASCSHWGMSCLRVPKPADLAAQAGCELGALESLLRAAAGMGCLTEPSPGSFSLTPRGGQCPGLSSGAMAEAHHAGFGAAVRLAIAHALALVPDETLALEARRRLDARRRV